VVARFYVCFSRLISGIQLRCGGEWWRGGGGGRGERGWGENSYYKTNPCSWAQSRRTESTNVKTEETSDNRQQIADSRQQGETIFL
jgi:hypothetical protein